MWVSYSNADRNRLWDGGRYFSIKGGGNGEGCTFFQTHVIVLALILTV